MPPFRGVGNIFYVSTAQTDCASCVRMHPRMLQRAIVRRVCGAPLGADEVSHRCYACPPAWSLTPRIKYTQYERCRFPSERASLGLTRVWSVLTRSFMPVSHFVCSFSKFRRQIKKVVYLLLVSEHQLPLKATCMPSSVSLWKPENTRCRGFDIINQDRPVCGGVARLRKRQTRPRALFSR